MFHHDAGKVQNGVQTGRLRPQWPAGSPRGLVDISRRCWAQDPGARPTFIDLIRELTKVEVELRTELLARKDTAMAVSDAGSGSSAASGGPLRGGTLRLGGS